MPSDFASYNCPFIMLFYSFSCSFLHISSFSSASALFCLFVILGLLVMLNSLVIAFSNSISLRLLRLNLFFLAEAYFIDFSRTLILIISQYNVGLIVPCHSALVCSSEDLISLL